jgi:hypothetical protein
MQEIASKSSWNISPIDNPKCIGINLHFNEKQFAKLTYGLIPEEMEEKWFIYFESDWLYFHRSWTGFGIYKAQLIREKAGYFIKEFWAERNEEKYSNTNDNEDIHTLLFLIARGLLDVEIKSIFTEKNIKPETDPLKDWSNYGSLNLSKAPSNKKARGGKSGKTDE